MFQASRSRSVFQAMSLPPRDVLCAFRASFTVCSRVGGLWRTSRATIAGADRTWGRANRARNKYTALNVIETIWYGGERTKLGNNGVLVTEALFGVIPFILGGGGKPDRYGHPGR